MDFGLKDKNILLIGGHSNIGKQVTLGFAREGAGVTIGYGHDEERAKVYCAAKELNELPIFIDENGNTTMMDVENKTRELLKKYPDLGLVVVDHISIVKTVGGKKSDTRVDEMRRISHQLHSLAKELSIAILAVAQLNRESVKGVVRRPRLSDIKESGAIEEDADVIILLYDEMYENNKQVEDKRLEDSRHL